MAGAKQFPASRKKLEKAREEGDVAKSPELSIGFSALTGILVLFWQAPISFAESRFYFEAVLGRDRDFHSKDMLVSIQEALLFGLRQLVPVLAVMWLSVLLAEAAQVGVKFSWEVLRWKWSRVSFLSGFKRICGWQEGAESSLPIGLLLSAGKSVLLVGGLGTVAAAVLLFCAKQVAGTDCRDPAELEWALEQVLPRVLFPLAGITFGIGLADWLFARLRRDKRLRMDFQELRQEFRESEGDPETRAMRKQLHQELLLHGMLEGIRSAKVVVLGRREEK